MTRLADLTVFAAVILLCVFSCHAGSYSAPEKNDCVSVKTSYRRNQADSTVATCSRAQDLEDSTQRLQNQVDTLERETEDKLNDQGGKIEDLEADVADLQGDNSALFRIAVRTIVGEISERRVLCELYTYGEALELTRLVYGIENTNPHFVHLPCEPDCPERFWKIRQGCYRPNDPPTEDGSSPFFNCIYDPLPGGETCTRVLHIGAFGYTTNVGENWKDLNEEETSG